MKYWYYYLTVVVSAVVVWFSSEGSIVDTLVTLGAGGIAVAIAVYLSYKRKAEDSTAAAAGIFFAFVATGTGSSLLGDLSPMWPWSVFLILFAGFSLAFSGLKELIHYPAVAAASTPAPVIEQPVEKNDEDGGAKTKVLDTSIIIDGRFNDIALTGFVEGPFVIPNFVLREIQLISDSPDPIKRNRGRRGLDMLNQLQKREDVLVKISYKDYTDTREVDAKLVKLAKELDGHLITNDFNLNKVAELQGVKVLNINNLANALKPVVLVGEEMDIQVVKEGKDENQGIGYLEDGTMVVIEHGGKLLGKKVKVSVTSVIQTNAGKMIFTRVMNHKNNN